MWKRRSNMLRRQDLRGGESFYYELWSWIWDWLGQKLGTTDEEERFFAIVHVVHLWLTGFAAEQDKRRRKTALDMQTKYTLRMKLRWLWCHPDLAEVWLCSVAYAISAFPHCANQPLPLRAMSLLANLWKIHVDQSSHDQAKHFVSVLLPSSLTSKIWLTWPIEIVLTTGLSWKSAPKWTPLAGLCAVRLMIWFRHWESMGCHQTDQCGHCSPLYGQPCHLSTELFDNRLDVKCRCGTI